MSNDPEIDEKRDTPASEPIVPPTHPEPAPLPVEDPEGLVDLIPPRPLHVIEMYKPKTVEELLREIEPSGKRAPSVSDASCH